MEESLLGPKLAYLEIAGLRKAFSTRNKSTDLFVFVRQLIILELRVLTSPSSSYIWLLSSVRSDVGVEVSLLLADSVTAWDSAFVLPAWPLAFSLGVASHLCT